MIYFVLNLAQIHVGIMQQVMTLPRFNWGSLSDYRLNYLQLQVEILTIWSDEDEVDSVGPGENVKMKLKNVEEEVSTKQSLSQGGGVHLKLQAVAES